MTSYEFEKAAKNAVIKVLNENINISELDLVWFAHELGYKKCTIWGQPMGDRYAEVTYNRDKDEMYVDTILEKLDFPYEYSHQNPFPTNTGATPEMLYQSFTGIFNKVANFL